MIAKDIIETDRRLWRKFESLALCLANKRGYYYPLEYSQNLLADLEILRNTLPHSTEICEMSGQVLLEGKNSCENVKISLWF